MSPSQPQRPPQPPTPGSPAWDIAVTRLMRDWRPAVDALALDLARRFQALGLDTDTQTVPTPRGLSTFVSLVGQRGLVCLVDLTRVDGIAVGPAPCVSLDIRLLDACGDVVAEALASGVLGRARGVAPVAEALGPDALDQAATAVYVAALAQFDLLRPTTRCG